MLQQKCTEMAQLADHEVVKREKVEDICQQTKQQMESVQEQNQSLSEAHRAMIDEHKALHQTVKQITLEREELCKTVAT
jgi:multidrug resistance efflux pump